MDRHTQFERKTAETRIAGELRLDGAGNCDIRTGVAFFDHMLGAAAKHGFFDLSLRTEGDLDVDAHHTLEDVGLVLGDALGRCLGDKAGIRRFGTAVVPMDDALSRLTVDVCGRAYCAYRVPLATPAVGGVPVLLFREFFRAFATAAACTLHVDKLAGDEPHHVLEATFKAWGRALDEALTVDPRIDGALSTKGTLG